MLRWFGWLRRSKKEPRARSDRSRLPRTGELLLLDSSVEDPMGRDRGYDPVFEQFRSIRDQLLAIPLERRPRLLMLTSSEDGEGKSYSVFQLGRAIAERGDLRVLLLDANLRAPRLHRFVDASAASPGFVECLREEAEPADCLIRTRVDALEILPGGEVPGNPSELLGSDAAQERLRELRDSYDFVLVDTPSLRRYSDAAALGRFLDAALLVVRLERTPRARIDRSLELLRQLEIPVLGCVLTGDREFSPATRYYARAEQGATVG